MIHGTHAGCVCECVCVCGGHGWCIVDCSNETASITTVITLWLVESVYCLQTALKTTIPEWLVYCLQMVQFMHVMLARHFIIFWFGKGFHLNPLNHHPLYAHSHRLSPLTSDVSYSIWQDAIPQYCSGSCMLHIHCLWLIHTTRFASHAYWPTAPSFAGVSTPMPRGLTKC